MKLIKHTNSIYEYQNFVDTDLCNEIFDWINPIVINKKEILDTRKTKIRHNNSVNITYLPPDKTKLSTYKKCHEIIENLHSKYIDDNKFLNYLIKTGSCDYGQLTGDIFYRTYDHLDYYDWHVDAHKGNLRLLYSYIIYLNDDFSGGNTLFLNEKKKIIPKIGSAICFPCDVHHVHKSTKILKGNKHILWTCLAKQV